MSFISPQGKLNQLFPQRTLKRSPLLFVVSYVNQTGDSSLVDEAFRDIEASLEGGADAVILINEWSKLHELESTLLQVRKRFPQIPLGVNYLGDESEPYGYKDSFRLSREYNLKVVWTDFSGVDQIHEKPDISLHEIASVRDQNAFYCSGVHMKYSTLRNPQKTIEQSAQQAMGWVDGVIVTGPQTGVPVSPEVVRRARSVLGEYPLGVASGVSPQNVSLIKNDVQFLLVASSLQDENKRIQKHKVRELVTALHDL